MLYHYKNYSLKNHNTFGIDVYADDFYEYSTVEDLELLLKHECLKNKRTLNIGSGSNILFLSDFKGTVLHSAIKGINIEEESDTEVIISAYSGVNWDDFVEWSVAHNFGGVENLSFIPGTVGASVVQNIGAYGVELKDVFYKVEGKYIENGEDFTFYLPDCNFDYRYSVFKDTLKDKIVITKLFLLLSKKPDFNLEYGQIKSEIEKQKYPVSLENIRNVIISIRKQKLPDHKITGNAGSFFKNPVISSEKFSEIIKQYPDMPYFDINKGENYKIPAGWLIEKTGWKGKRIGNAGVHSNQALVLVNYGGATGKDIMKLAAAIENDIERDFGIILEKEVNVIC